MGVYKVCVEYPLESHMINASAAGNVISYRSTLVRKLFAGAMAPGAVVVAVVMRLLLMVMAFECIAAGDPEEKMDAVGYR